MNINIILNIQTFSWEVWFKMDHRDEQGVLKIRNLFDPAVPSTYIIHDDWYFLIHTWQSVSEQTLPTADNSVPLRQPQKRHASELLVVGLPRSAKANKTKGCCNETQGTDMLTTDSWTTITENKQKTSNPYAVKLFYFY